MEIDKIVADLKKERDRLVKAITALVGVGSVQRLPAGSRGRKPGPKAATREEQAARRYQQAKAGSGLSELMKKRWAERRKKGMTKLAK